MDGAKEYMKQKGIYPRISFKDKQPHTVELVKDKVETINTSDGEQDGVKFLVKEGGEMKSFFTSSEALISKLSQYNQGDTVTIKMVGRNVDGQYRTSFEVDGEDTTNSPEKPTELNFERESAPPEDEPEITDADIPF